VPAGYVTFYLTYSTFLARPSFYLEDIFVREEFRHRGIGRELFSFCRKLARERGCGRMDWQVLTWNEPAIRFYENEGGKRLDWYSYRIGEGEL
jgi:GNAT superfamily N-acetyltransferase